MTDPPRCGGHVRTLIHRAGGGRWLVAVAHHGWRIEETHRGTGATAEHYAGVLRARILAHCAEHGMADPLGRT